VRGWTDRRERGRLAQRKSSSAAADTAVERRLEALELQRRNAREQGLGFSAPGAEEVERRVRAGLGPEPTVAWTQYTTRVHITGGTFKFDITLEAGEVPYAQVFVSTWFGASDWFPSIELSYAARDTRFPNFSSPPLVMAPAGALITQPFTFAVPRDVGRSTFFGNFVLWHADFLGTGTVWARGGWNIEIFY
jgi:hypothetical protein